MWSAANIDMDRTQRWGRGKREAKVEFSRIKYVPQRKLIV